MPPEKREFYIIGAACLIVIVGAVSFIASRRPPAGPAAPPESPGSATATAPPVGYNPAVPAGATVSAAAAEAPAAPGAAEKFRSYNISMSARGYDPKTVTVRKGDVVQLQLTAVDGDYDFIVPYTGLYQFVRRGETKQVGFGATMEGSFEFSCRDRCPPSGSLRGQLVVIP